MTDQLCTAIAQFHGTENWQDNLETCMEFMRDARSKNVDLLVLPEAAMQTRDGTADPSGLDPQPLDGPFVKGLLEESTGHSLCTIVGFTEKTTDERPSNTLLAFADGQIVSVYRKIHLYDAFSAKESDRILPGDGPLELFTVKDFKIGMMTCYDVRFPEVARLLAEKGADVLALPAAWITGPLKERHWEVMSTARALENNCYVAAAGKTGPGRIGLSSIIDPLGVAITQLGAEDGLGVANISRAVLDDTRTRLPLMAQRRFKIDPSPISID